MNLSELLKSEVGGYTRSKWEGVLGKEKVTLFALPLSPADTKIILRHHPEFTNRPDPSAMARAIMLKATDEEGKKVFTTSDLPILERLQVAKIGEMFGGLFGDQFEENDDVDVLVGNSETTPTD
jgi:hypothetical protein